MPAEPRPSPNLGPNDRPVPPEELNVGSGTGISRQVKPDVPVYDTESPSVPSAPKEMPARFVCYQCGTCVATSESLVDSRDDVVVFSRLYCKDSGDRANRTVLCPDCESAVGTRSEGTYILRRERVEQRLERLEILVCSLKQQEISEVIPVLTQVFPHSHVHSKILLKAELRGFQFTGPAPDLVVVVHRNEGRVLLTDRNGFYHDVIGAAWQQTRGNVLVVLTKTEPKAEADLFDTGLLRSLSTQGDQPTIGAISALGRVLTWGSAPSTPQLQQLLTLTTTAYFREPPGNAPGLPGHWIVKPTSKQAQAAAWCALL